MATLLITGVGRGIGFELARQAIEAGDKVVGSVRDQARASQLGDLWGAAFQPLVFDVTDGEALSSAASGLDRAVDILIHNAGVVGPLRQTTLDTDFDGFLGTLEINTLAPLRVVQAFLPHVERSARGRILAISSRMGSLSYAKSDRIAYRASKAALNKVLQGLATDLKPRGIAVAAIHPGWVRTDMGGPEADIDVQVSANGILALARAMNLNETGRFWNYDATEMAW